MLRPTHIMVIDPAVRTAEVATFNALAVDSPLPLTYHLPAMAGIDSLYADQESLAGIIVLGSASSVNERLEWQVQLEKWLLPLIEKGTPTLGLCYGHQMIAHLFGARVGFLFPDKKKLTGFKKVTLEPDRLWDNKALEGLLFVSHREVVQTCPEQMQIICSREQVPIDGLAHRTLPVWTLQSHPEAVPGFLNSQEGASEKSSSCYQFGNQLVRRFLAFAKQNDR